METQSSNKGAWIATTLIAVLLLCCGSLVGVALLDELLPSHPLQSVILGSPTPTATRSPTDTGTPSATPTYGSTPIPELVGDPFEPDDSPAQATSIEIGGARQEHTLSPPGDRDYISFQVEAGVAYAVETGALGSQCDTLLTLYY